jgi:hypothetical protein
MLCSGFIILVLCSPARRGCGYTLVHQQGSCPAFSKIGAEVKGFLRPCLRCATEIDGWVQMDFKDADSKGNFALKHYHENYGYDLESVLSKHPIKELGNNSHKDDLMNSLKKDNLQSATFIKDGQEVKQYIEATPQFKTLTVYDADMKRLDTRQAKEQGQSQGTGEGKSQDTKKQQSATEEDGPGETQEKKQRRKKQSL